MFEENGLKSSLSHFISGCIIIAILLIMIPISYRLPGSSEVIFSSHGYNLELAHLIVLALVLAIIWVLFNIRYSAQLLLKNLVAKGDVQRYSTTKLLTDNIVNIVYVLIIYVVVMMFVRKVVATFPNLNWLFTILTLSLIGFVLFFLIPLYRGLRTYLEASTRISAERVTVESKNNSFIICPKCGYKNPPGSKFCVSCGTKLAEVPEEKTKEEEVKVLDTEEQGLICPKCGYKNPPGSKFCVSCGTKLAEVPEEKTKEEE